MRYWIGLVLAVAIAGGPVAAQAQRGVHRPPGGSWMQLQLNEPESLHVPSATRPSLAYAPEDLEQQQPTSRVAPPQPAQATDTTNERTPQVEPYAVDPDMSPMGIQRWHPEAFDPAVKSERELEMRYVPLTPEEAARKEERRLRNKAIAIGVVVPVLVVGVVGLGVGIAASSWKSAWE